MTKLNVQAQSGVNPQLTCIMLEQLYENKPGMTSLFGSLLLLALATEDPVSVPSGRLEKTTRSSPHHVAQHRPTGSETTPPYAPRSSSFGSEPPSVEDDVGVWRYATVSCMPETTTTTSITGGG